MSLRSIAPQPAGAPSRGPDASWAVELRDVFRVHRTPQGDAAALQGASLHVRRGEIVAVLGPSGAGKSTLLRVVAGLEPPSAGDVLVMGRDVGRLPPRARAGLRRETIGFLDQRAAHTLPPDLPVRVGMVLGLSLRGAPRSAREQRADELLDAVGMRDRGSARPGELSGGERQRLALCAALAHRPALLLADEPSGELDDVSARAVHLLMAELARAEGATVLLVSHDPASALYADRAVRLRDGRVGEEARGGETALVVGRGGWLRLPAELLAGAGIRSHARAHAVPGGIVVEPDASHADAAQTPARRGSDRWAVCERARETLAFDPAIVELRALEKGYGSGRARREILDRLSAHIVPGRLTAVTGRSGTGKSTLLRLLCGLEQPDAGDVLLDGQSLTGRSPERLAAMRRERIGFLAQDPGLVPFLAADENIVLALTLRGVAAAGARAQAHAWLARVGLGERVRQRVERLSAGERQRVALARALAAARGLLVVDEPTSCLDEATTATAAELLASACEDHGLTVVCATHEELVLARSHAQLAL